MILRERNSLMKLYRLMNGLHERKIPIFPGLIMRVIRVIYSCELPYICKLGQGVIFKHNGLGVVVHPKAVIGNDTQVYQNVTIGGRHNRGAPVIGERVFIGAGACILGGVNIGDDSVIGANSVVISDVPPETVVAGVPAKVIKDRN